MTDPQSQAISAHYAQADVCVKSGKWAEAAEAYRHVIALRPDDAVAHINLGNSLLAMHRVADAIAALQAAAALQPSSAAAVYNLGNAYARASRWDDAMAAYRGAIALDPAAADAYSNFGYILLNTGQAEAALAPFQAALRLRPDFVEAHRGRGKASAALDRREDAIQSFTNAWRLRPQDADLCMDLGSALLAGGQFAEARDAYAEAIRQGGGAVAFHNLANVLVILGRDVEAVVAYERAVAVQPDLAEAWINMSIVLIGLRRAPEAVAAAMRAVSLDPSAPDRHYQLGNALRAGGRNAEAIAAFRRALLSSPGDTKTEFALANLLVESPQTRDEAVALFQRAHRAAPLQKRPGAASVPAFAVLAFNAPGVANTPSDYLLGRANYDTYGALVVEGIVHDAAALRAQADVVVNLVSEADLGRDILPELGALIDRIGRPVINHPRYVLNTGRDTVAHRLAGIAGCRIPRTLRLSGRLLGTDTRREAVTALQAPLLVRTCGTHGGDDLEKVETGEAALAAVDRAPDLESYITEYIPYESRDGYFRKYRLFSVNGELFPYHLAISNHWKVHYFRTDMAHQDWMRGEEEAFIRDWKTIFQPRHCEALRQIQQTVNLDFFGIDCGFDQSGDLLVFEVNATMLIHGEWGTFSYKQPAIARIKQAFDALLEKAAARTPA